MTTEFRAPASLPLKDWASMGLECAKDKLAQITKKQPEPQQATQVKEPSKTN